MTATAITALLCAALYTGLLAITLSRRADRTAALAAIACAVTVSWAVALAAPALHAAPLLPLLDTAKTIAWIALLTMLAAPSLAAHPDRRLRHLLLATPLAVAIAAFGNDVLRAFSGDRALAPAQIFGRESMAIFGLLLVENLYRNTAARRQWNVVPLATAMGGFFAYQLCLYSDALLFGSVSVSFAAAQPAIDCLVAPFLALSLIRNQGWKIKLHVSQRVVLHGLTLIASGIFLIAIVTVADLLPDWGGERWGEVVEVTSLFGSIMLLVTVLSSASLKARLKYLISRNFFALRYDYRVEWMSFIDLLSTREAGEDLKRRAIEGIANIVNAPAGALWLRDGAGASASFLPVTLWNMRLPSDAAEPGDSDFVKGFRGGYWIQEFHRGCRGDGARGDCWLAVPLANRGRLIGFITLASSRMPFELNWESFELLRALARQAASYIDEERLSQQLQDAKSLHDYAQRFAFVAHDLKSLAAQLRLVLVNAERHGDDPAFRADMFATLQYSVARMSELLQQLRANDVASVALPVIDAVPVIRRVLAARPEGRGIAAAIDCAAAPVAIDPEGLTSAIKHLLDNALEASPQAGKVALAARCGEGRLVIDIADDGAGMDVEFIHDQLFRPFRSTKPEGHGIGAYQTRELLRRAGGDLQVASAPGAGTTMRIVLPLAKEGAILTAA